MGKRLLAGFLTMCLLLGGCSADRGSLASLVDESSSHEMHTVICWITNNGHLMDVQISVPLSWEVSQEKNWNLEADGKTVVEFKIHSYVSLPMDISDYDWSSLDAEYMERQDLIEAGDLEISGMSGRYYRCQLTQEQYEVVYCSVFDGTQVISFNYYPDSGVPLEEVEQYLVSVIVKEQE